MYKKQIVQAIIFWLICFIIVCCIILIQRNINTRYYQNIEPMEKVSHKTWYTENNVIIHASGGIDGLTYTNSQEALFSTIAKGGKVIEIDFDYTSDGYLVCYHMYKDTSIFLPGNFTKEEFLNSKIQGKYTPMSIEDIVEFMKMYPDIYISVDTKHEKIEEVVKSIIAVCNDKEILDRFIIQCFFPKDKEKVKAVYEFPEDNYFFTAYKYSSDPYDVLKVCYEEDFNVVATNQNDWGKETLDLFKSKNIYVYLHTINRFDVAYKKVNIDGAYGIYSDFLFDIEKE